MRLQPLMAAPRQLEPGRPPPSHVVPPLSGWLAPATAVALACTAWLSAGTLAVTDAAARTRSGLLPPVWILAALTAATLVSALIWRRAIVSAAAVALLAALPWLPLAVPPAALLWAGPLAWLPWLALAVCLVLSRQRRAPAWLGTPRGGTAAVFVLCLAVYLGSFARLSNRLPFGDEPHYLMIAQSLLADGDLRIENNHANADYAPFFDGVLPPDYLRRGQDGEIYSIHAPGLAALILPAYALSGHPGSAMWLACFAALGAALAWRLARDVTGNAGAAWFGVAAAALSAPVLLHAFTIFPDAPAAVLAVAGLRGLAEAAGVTGTDDGSAPAPSAGRALAAGTALALLPWLHTRYAVIAAALGICTAWHLWRRARAWRGLAAFLAVPAVSAVSWFGFFLLVYGTPSPAAPYAGQTQTGAAHLLPGVTGLLADYRFGLLTHAPVLVFALGGVAALWRARGTGRPLGVALALVLLVYPLMAASYRMWWGGMSGPARFLVPVLLLLTVPLAAFWAAPRSRATRTMAAAALVLSLAIAAGLVMAADGALAYKDRLAADAWALRASPVVNLALALPSVLEQPLPRAIAIALVWVAAAFIVWIALAWRDRRRPETPVMPGVAALIVGLGITAAAGVGWIVAGAAPGRPVESQTRLLERMPRRLRGPAVVLREGVGLTPARVVDRQGLLASLALPGQPVIAAGDRHFDMPPLPPGLYLLDLPGPPFAGVVTIQVGDTDVPLAPLQLPTSSAHPPELFFPVRVPPWRVVLPAPGAGRAIAVRPVQPVEAPETAGGVAQRAVGYGATQVYFMDGSAYPEPSGFWVEGRGATRLVVSQSGAAAPLTLAIRNVPRENSVTITTGRWSEALSLAPDEERTVVAPRPGRTMVLEIRTTEGVRPSEVDPRSGDRRLLGVWVRPAG